jgi:hypothetical protein
LKKYLLLFCLVITSCAGFKLKDLNKVNAGMSQKEVIAVLGSPASKRLAEGQEVFEYQLEDENGEVKPRLVVFEDKEVVFYGKPSDFSKTKSSTSQTASGGNHNTNSNSVAPIIKIAGPTITVSPVINLNHEAKQKEERTPAANSYFHDVPVVDPSKKQEAGQ